MDYAAYDGFWCIVLFHELSARVDRLESRYFTITWAVGFNGDDVLCCDIRGHSLTVRSATFWFAFNRAHFGIFSLLFSIASERIVSVFEPDVQDRRMYAES